MLNSYITNKENFDWKKKGKEIYKTIKAIPKQDKFMFIDINNLSDELNNSINNLLKKAYIPWDLDYLKERLNYKTNKFYLYGEFKNNNLSNLIAGFVNSKNIWYDTYDIVEIVFYSENELLLSNFYYEMNQLGYNKITLVNKKYNKDAYFKTSYYLVPIYNTLIDNWNDIYDTIKKYCLIDKTKVDMEDFVIPNKNIEYFKEANIKDLDIIYELYKLERYKYPIFDNFNKEELKNVLFNNKYVKTYLYESKDNIDFISYYETPLGKYKAATLYLYSSESHDVFKCYNELAISAANNGINFLILNKNMNYHHITEIITKFRMKNYHSETFYNLHLLPLNSNCRSVKLMPNTI